MTEVEVAPLHCPSLADSCSDLPESELQRACAPLYAPIAVDALANFILFCFFFYVALLTHLRGKLRSPLKALGRLMLVFAQDYLRELWDTVKSIPSMATLPLAARLRCCSNIDKAVSVVSTSIPLIALTRFLNFGNVNGARYVGYALTCPFMQMELVVLIAPIVPFFSLNAGLTFVVTGLCLGLAWISSIIDGPLYDGLFGEFLDNADLQALRLTTKGYIIIPAMVGMFGICYLQVPYMAIMYICRGRGERKEDMPEGYLPLIVTVIITWSLFPIWWLFSWEGASIFKDAKLNELGFMAMNMMAKGFFIYQSTRMSQRYADKFPDKMNTEEEGDVPDIVSRRHSIYRRRNSQLVHTLERFASDAHKAGTDSFTPAANSPTADGGIEPAFSTIGPHHTGAGDRLGTLAQVGGESQSACWSVATGGGLGAAPYPSQTELMIKEVLDTIKRFEEEMALTRQAAENAFAVSEAALAGAPVAAEKCEAPKDQPPTLPLAEILRQLPTAGAAEFAPADRAVLERKDLQINGNGNHCGNGSGGKQPWLWGCSSV